MVSCDSVSAPTSGCRNRLAPWALLRHPVSFEDAPRSGGGVPQSTAEAVPFRARMSERRPVTWAGTPSMAARS